MNASIIESIAQIPRLPVRRALAALLLGATLVLAGCGREPPQAAPAGPPIRVGAYFWPGMYWLDIADRKGWFREAGLNVERVDTNADYFASQKDLIEGRLDVVGFTLYDLVLHNARGRPLVGFLASDISAGAESLVARPGIGNLSALAGKRLGLSRGTYLEFMWSIISSRAGLAPGAVRLVDMPAEKAAAELKAGRVDAVFTWEPIADEALAAVNGKELFDSAQMPGITWGVYVGRGDFLRQREGDIQKFVEVWRRTEAFIRSRPEEAYAIVAEANRKTAAEARAFTQLDHVLDLKGNRTAFSFASGFDSLHGAARMINDFQLRAGLVDKQIDTTALLDPRFVEALDRRGGQ